MNLLALREVTLAFGGEPVLEDVTLNIESGMRACVTGRNGEGKSTLLKVIAGELEVDRGEIIRAPNLRVAYLAQDVPHDRPGSVADVVGTGAAAAKYISQMELDGAAEFNSLSGGMRRRVLLAQALATDPNLVLLDEPTNHLDVKSIEWLEAFIKRQTETTFLFVTHDRAFLRSTATYVIDLDRGRLAGWNCDWRTFLQRKADLATEEEAMWTRKAKKLATEEAWIRQGVKARRTRNQGRVEELRKLRLEFASRRSRPGTTSLTIDTAASSGDRVIKIEHLSFGYSRGSTPVPRQEAALPAPTYLRSSNLHANLTNANMGCKGPLPLAGGVGAKPPFIIKDFTADILRGERIGIIGLNGAGKTTLLNLLCKKLEPVEGEVTIGTKVELAFFDQLRAQLNLEASVAENIASDRDTVTVGGVTKHIYAYLADFLFTPERSRTPVKALSGGERARLLLAKLFLQPSNLLVLDEPTNDLDIETLELLEEQLLRYRGTLLVVSHDREFLENVVTAMYVLDGTGAVQMCMGGYAAASKLLNPPPSPKPTEAPSKEAPPASKKSAKLSYKETRELAALPERIAALEEEIAAAETALQDPSLYRTDPSRAAALTARLPLARTELDEAETRWLELSDRE